MSRRTRMMILALLVLFGVAAVVTLPIIRDAGGETVVTTDEVNDCFPIEETLREAEAGYAEVEARLIVLDEQYFADPTDQDIIVERSQVELELARAGADVAVAQRALDTCQGRLSVACEQANDELVALTTERTEVMEARNGFEDQIRDLDAAIRNPGDDTDVAAARRDRSTAMGELTRKVARLTAIDEQLPNLERQVAVCGPTGLTPGEQPEDHGTGDPDGDDLWSVTCGASNEDAQTYFYRNHPDVGGSNYFGPPSQILEMTDGTAAEAVIDMNHRRCFDPALVVAHLVSAGDHGVVGFEGWAGMSTQVMHQKTKDFAGDREIWAQGVASLRAVEDALETRLTQKTGELNESMFMKQGPNGVPLIYRSEVGAPTYVALQYVDATGRVMLAYKLDCGYQPEWPKDRPPAPVTPPPNNPPPGEPPPDPTPTTVPTPNPTTTVPTPGPTTTVPTPTTTVPTPTTTVPTPTTTTPPEEPPKCVDEHGNLVEGADPDGDGLCGTPDSGPDYQDPQDNDPADVAPTPDAPVIPPPAPEPVTPEDEEAVGGGNPPAPELADDPPAPAPTDVCPGVPGQQLEGPCESIDDGGSGQPVDDSGGDSGGDAPVDWCPEVPGIQADGTLCPPPPPPPPPPSG